jgi:hypothetical protein
MRDVPRPMLRNEQQVPLQVHRVPIRIVSRVPVVVLDPVTALSIVSHDVPDHGSEVRARRLDVGEVGSETVAAKAVGPVHLAWEYTISG